MCVLGGGGMVVYLHDQTYQSWQMFSIESDENCHRSNSPWRLDSL
jgi:hypothetical protein